MSNGMIAGLMVLVVAACPAAARAKAQTPDDWHRVDALRRGTAIVVTLATGEERPYVFESSTAVDLAVVAPGGIRDVLPKSLVSRVVRSHPHGDRLRNGIIAGALAGAAIALTTLVVSAGRCGEGCEGPESYGPLAGVAAGVGAGGGATIGWLVDRRHTGVDLVFERPTDTGDAPVTASDVSGAALRLPAKATRAARR